MPESRGLAGLQALHDSIGTSGSPAQQAAARPYREELDALRGRFDQIRSGDAPQGEARNFMDALDDVFGRIEVLHNNRQVTETDYRGVMGHLMAWFAALDH
jgi:hypothetical protein